MLYGLLHFYAKIGGRVLDCTANTKKMWKGVEWSGEIVFSDIDPSCNPDVVVDFRETGFQDSSFDVIVFDPPHLPSAAASPKSMIAMSSIYGLERAPNDDNVSSLFSPFLLEARRILRPDGLVFAKIKGLRSQSQIPVVARGLRSRRQSY